MGFVGRPLEDAEAYAHAGDPGFAESSQISAAVDKASAPSFRGGRSPNPESTDKPGDYFWIPGSR